MGRSSQRKGRAAERELAGILQGYGFPDARPGAPVCYGSEPDLLGVPNVHIEVKRRESVDIAAALRQARADAEYFGGIPALFCRDNGERWRVVIDLADWIKLYKGEVGHDGSAEDNTGREETHP